MTDVHKAETALRSITREMEILLAGIPQLVWRASGVAHWSWASSQWADYTGQSGAESAGPGWLDKVDLDDHDAVLSAWAHAETEGGLDVQCRIYDAAERCYRWFYSRAAPVRDEQGAIVEWLGTSTDIDETRMLQGRQEMLLGELQHRVRNMLGVVRSVFTRTAETANDIEEIVNHFTGRLDSLARTQVIVTRNTNGMVELGELIRDELQSMAAGDERLIRIDGPHLVLESKAAEAIGPAIHELTTNALKYGALKVPAARLDIHWLFNGNENDKRRLDLVWEEHGVPMISIKPTRTGFGRELIEKALPYQLRAETRLVFREGGVRCTIAIPLGDQKSGNGGQ